MRSIEDTLYEIEERIASRREELREECRDGGTDGHTASIMRGYLDALTEIREFILEIE